MLKAIVSLGALTAIHYQYRTIQKPKLYFKKTPENQFIIKKLPILEQKYAVTPWLINPHAQIIYMTLKHKIRNKPLAYQPIEQCRMLDGATTEIAWLGYDLPQDCPTIIMLHTVTGDTQSMTEIVEDLYRQTGWRIALCLRRGHTTTSQPFTSINIMGSVPDFQAQLDHIQRKFPDSPLYAVGSSAGTAVLARYLGEVGKNTPLRGAFAYCPGYDLNVAFDRVHKFYDRYMATSIKKRFILPYQQQLQQHPALQPVIKSKRLQDIQKVLFEFAGFDSYKSYLNACNPIDVFTNIAIPTMILNAEDDPICHINNAWQYREVIEANSATILVTTRHGSHCGHYQGLKPRSWAHHLIASYLLTIHTYNRSSQLVNKKYCNPVTNMIR
ncbi:YheT family hydrolase [Acinetobacter qingfengensis]|uniref:AB hydrolase-1 domain-containing protein n=1 Tax=Acinetobacter qingfengensis TaxID=1262585 RepID=A0A1E7QXL2_9GAMM|nr:alpha/beta fold hydrolase [Acinetobacter qingfengensis]OEY91805.1 hypothetical protein BJI46_06630 [Acinetobacter qingfengensis]